MSYRSSSFLRLVIGFCTALLLLLWMFLEVGVSSSVIAPAASQDLVWNMECVDCPKDVGNLNDRSLRVDQDGHPHLVYGSDHLYYAWHDGASWHLETIDSDYGSGRSASLALDADGNARISYFGANKELKYASQQDSSWQIETVDSVDLKGVYISLALDADGLPDIVYSTWNGAYDYHGVLRYAYLEAGQWLTETIDTEANVGRNISMALDDSGYPHLVYYHLTSWVDGSLKYAYRDAGGWQIQDFNDTVDVARDASLAMDNQGFPHVSYYDPLNFDLMHAYKDATRWYTETVDAAGTVGFGSALQIAGDGKPYISYLGVAGVGQLGLKLAYYANTEWQIQEIVTGTNHIVTTALDVDVNGKAHVSYYDGGYLNSLGPYQLMYALQAEGGWQVDILDNAGDVGQYLSMALDDDNRAHVNYYDVKNQDLKYAYQDGFGWHTEIAHGTGKVGKYPSMDLDASGYPHVSYYDEENKDLWYAFRDAAGWHLVDLIHPSSYASRIASSLKVDQSGFPHIVYIANDQSEIKHLYQDAAGWHTVTIATGNVGDSYVSLALDANDRLHVGYTDEGLRYAHQDETGWLYEIVDVSSAEAGYFNSIALDASGNPRISYFIGWTKLQFAYRDGSGWHNENVDNVVSAASSSVLDLDDEGYAHISYADVVDGYTKHAYQDSMVWHSEIIDDRGYGFGNSIGIDENNRPHIAYGYRDLYVSVLAPVLDQRVYLPLLLR